MNQLNQEILTFCMEKGVLLDKKLLDVFEKYDNFELIKNLIEKISFQYHQKIINVNFFINNQDKLHSLLLGYNKDDRKFLEEMFLSLGINLKNELENKLPEESKGLELKNELNLLRIYQNKPKKIEVGDFVKNFRHRYVILKNILQERPELENLISISRLESNKSCSIIGMVYSKRITKNDNVLLEIEDLTGRVTALINKNRPEVYEKSKEILLDEVIGLKCSGNRELVFVNDIFFPETFLQEKKKSKNEEIIAFTSDIHVGSDKFLEKNFLKFIKWLNGEVGDAKQKETALKVKYLFITGDSIDGVGVYPGQETQLIIKDIKEQYKKLAELLSLLRSDIKIIICPGQHDAVRVAEPQPLIGDFYGEDLYNLENVYLVTNPSIVEVGDAKFKILMYHGASMHGIINSIDELRTTKSHNTPTKVVKYMLKKRHLAPSHSLVTYTPCEGEDALLINIIPDILSTGDLHRPEISNYNGVLLIASSCWQSITPFEEKVGNNPDPCKVPIFNLKTREIKMLDFSSVSDDSDNGVLSEKEVSDAN